MSWFYKFNVTQEQVTRIDPDDNVTVQHLLDKLKGLSDRYVENHLSMAYAWVVYGYGVDERIPPIVSQLNILLKKESKSRAS